MSPQSYNEDQEQTQTSSTCGYFSKIYSYMSSKSSSPHISVDSEDDIQDDYCIITSPNPFSVSHALWMMAQSNVDWTHITHELDTLFDYLDKTCHQFDRSRITDQFANTHVKMGPEISLFTQFVTKRYKASPWLVCMALILIVYTCLHDTPTEVKRQLVYETRIGKEFVYSMIYALQSKKTVLLSQSIMNQVAKRVFSSQRHNWRTALVNICNELAKYDESFKSQYDQVVTMTTTLFVEEYLLASTFQT